MFIIYSIAIAGDAAAGGDRLWALGATRGQIRTLFLMESALTGLVGTIVGVFVGLVLARAMAGYIGGFLERRWSGAGRGRDQPGPETDGGGGCHDC